jgi:hypothetical protein
MSERSIFVDAQKRIKSIEFMLGITYYEINYFQSYILQMSKGSNLMMNTKMSDAKFCKQKFVHIGPFD